MGKRLESVDMKNESFVQDSDLHFDLMDVAVIATV